MTTTAMTWSSRSTTAVRAKQNWQLLKDNVTERYYTFDAAQIPDGAYQLKVVASDAPSHNPGEALIGERTSERFVLDTATPNVGNLVAHLEGGKLHITAEAKDPASAIARAEYSIDAGPWQYIEPVGKISDATTRAVRLLCPAAAAVGSAARGQAAAGQSQRAHGDAACLRPLRQLGDGEDGRALDHIHAI